MRKLLWAVCWMALVPIAMASAGAAEPDDPVVFREEGKASFYSDKFQGKRTASGEKFDQRGLVAAHPTLPLGSEVTVTNAKTGKEVTVEVIDRGPHKGGRDIDLSKAAARKLDIVDEGVASVQIEATQGQVQQAIDDPEQVDAVVDQLKKARRAAAKDGTPQPKALPDLVPPDGAGG